LRAKVKAAKHNNCNTDSKHDSRICLFSEFEVILTPKSQ